MHFKTIFKSLKNKDMLKKFLVILGILFVYRLLAHIPVPLGDITTFRDAVHNLISSTNFGSFLNMISGGGLTNFSIILVGISPYITASIVIQLLTKAIPSLEEISEDGEVGRRKINQWTRLLAVPLAIVQAIAYIYLLNQNILSSTTAVTPELTTLQWLIAVVSMVAGSILLMWLGELMTEQGIGNGMSTLILASIISTFPNTFANLWASLIDTSTGTLSLFGWLNLPVNPITFWIILGFCLALIIVIYFLTKLNEAQRILTINYAKRIHGNSAYGDIRSILPLKLISAGVIPVIFATAFLSLPALVGQIILSSNADSILGQKLVALFTAPSASTSPHSTPLASLGNGSSTLPPCSPSSSCSPTSTLASTSTLKKLPTISKNKAASSKASALASKPPTTSKKSSSASISLAPSASASSPCSPSSPTTSSSSSPALLKASPSLAPVYSSSSPSPSKTSAPSTLAPSWSLTTITANLKNLANLKNSQPTTTNLERVA